MKRFGKLIVVLAVFAVTLAVAPGVIGVESAEALDCAPRSSFATQAQLMMKEDGCRYFASDPGFNKLLDGDDSNRSQLLSTDRRQLYIDNDFTDNFLWYSREDTLTFSEANDPQWTGCDRPNPVGETCANVVTAGANPYSVFNSLAGAKTENGGSGSVDLDVFVYGDMWIARVCGNWKAFTEPTKPVPLIPIEKFEDANRNGVRDPGEGPVAGVEFKIRRISSRVGQDPGAVPTAQPIITNAAGEAAFLLDGHGPGTYEIIEVVPADSIATTPTTRTVEVDFGIEDKQLDHVEFGNAPKFVDVAKTNFDVTMPDNFDARTDGEVTVDVTVTNNGPADHVPVTDEVVLTVPVDCVATPARREFSATLGINESASRSFTFAINCDRPSFHDFQFDDLLTVDDRRLVETDLANNTAVREHTRPVLAETDLSTTSQVDCPARTDVGVPITCSVSTDVTNAGYGPIDATVDVDIEQTFELDDCTSEPSSLQYEVADLADGETRVLSSDVVVTCGHRSDHQVTATASATADDIHVIDIDPSNDESSAAADFEVFHDADLTADNIALLCTETLGSPNFTCQADVEVNNAGPAPDVIAKSVATIVGQPDCTYTPSPTQGNNLVLPIDVPQTTTFVWNVKCTNGVMLHPFNVTADVMPDEPHAVDEPGPIDDDWTVPYCMETVNPSGNNIPSAPGNGGQGQNQDGFYTFGAKTLTGPALVWIEDEGTGTLFGPFESGVRIKYIEANGATPTITPMAGNNGKANGKGNLGNSVDYQIKGQGDAVAIHYDEDGNEIRVSCLVPPFPQ